MDIIFVPFLKVLIEIIGLYTFLLIVYVVLTCLESFGIVNRYHNLVYTVHNFLFSITEPLLRPFRRIIPLIGGFDIAPIALMFSLYFIKNVLILLISKFPI